MTLRHTNEENGQPCRSRTGGPDPSSTYATRASPTSAKRFEREGVGLHQLRAGRRARTRTEVNPSATGWLSVIEISPKPAASSAAA